jgi:chemotaxis protein methyltransferase CheR
MISLDLSPSLAAAYTRLIEERFGMRLLASQVLELNRRVLEVLPDTSFGDPGELYSAFAAGVLPRVLELLAGRLSIGETHFFRVMPQIEALRQTVLPDVIARHATDRRLRVWSAGCSTGEEAYTLAMLIRDQLPTLVGWDIQLVASDLDQGALDVAQQGLYTQWSFRDSPSDMRRRYFTPVGQRWQLSDPLRRMVRFVQHNLTTDGVPCLASGEQFDLIVCRFVTIYFDQQVAQRLYRRFAAALQPSGWLLLGPSDPMPAPTSGFELVQLTGALAWRGHHAVARAPALPPAVPLVQPPIRRLPVDQRLELTATAQPELAPASGISVDAHAYLTAGLLQLDQGAAEAAIDSLRRAAFLDDHSALIQFALGSAYRQTGDRSRSRSALARARRLLAGVGDDVVVANSEAATGELRCAVDALLADLDRTRR